MQRPRRKPFVLLFAIELAIAVAVVTSPVACGRDAPTDPLPGVRLGMTPRDVRERFEEGARGSWQTHLGGGSPGTSDDTVLTWSALSTGLATSGNDHGPNRAVFEFHLGMLVAMRAHLRERPAGVGTDEYVEVTSKTVTSRRPGASETGGTDVTVLALDCPTHRQEAQRMASKAVK